MPTGQTLFVACLVTGVLAGVVGAEDRIYVPGKGWVLPPSKGEPGSDLAGARALLAAGRVREARRLGELLLDTAEDPADALRARIFLGDLYVLTDRMSDARGQYDAVLAEAPENGPLYREAMGREYELAWHLLVGGRKRSLKVWGFSLPLLRVSGTDHGLELLREIRSVRVNVDEELPARALQLAAEHHFAGGDYDIAEQEYAELHRRFPNRRETATARQQEAVSALALFRGTEYDMDPLRTAATRLREFAGLHPDEAAAINADVVMQRLAWNFARRDYETAEFYRRLGDIRPSIRYYRSVVRRFPRTPWAEFATRQLATLGADDVIAEAGPSSP